MYHAMTLDWRNRRRLETTAEQFLRLDGQSGSVRLVQQIDP